MKKLLLLLSLCCSTVVFGQTWTYSFSREVDTFIDIAGQPGTINAAISADDITQPNIPIGFPFTYCGATYTQLAANSNGWLALNNTIVSLGSFYNVSAADMFTLGGGVGFIMPFWDDLNGGGGPPTPPVIPPSMAYYQTSGIIPNRVFTFQWGSPTNLWHSYLSFGDATFQAKLYETSGVIEFVYGLSTYTAKTATIGLANNSTSDFMTLHHDTALYATYSTWHHSIDTTPEYQTVIQWAPPCPNVPFPNVYVPDSVVCVGSQITLSNADTIGGGRWVSSSASVATAGSATGMDTVGIVTGVAAGVVNISYRLNVNCYSIKVVTVNPIPDTIGGDKWACENQTKTYTCASTGGDWSSSNTAVGTISTTGVFAGLTAGNTTLSYTFPLTGCYRTLDVTVNSQPLISGWPFTCLTEPTVLTNAVAGGTWSSSNTGRATVDAGGSVLGITLGTVIISYTAPSGCIDTMMMTVQTICTDAVKDVKNVDNSILLYPQPTNGDFYISLPVTGVADISITDLLGKTMVTRTVDGIKSDLVHFSESSKLPPGNYVFKLVAGSQTYVNKLTVVK